MPRRKGKKKKKNKTVRHKHKNKTQPNKKNTTYLNKKQQRNSVSVYVCGNCNSANPSFRCSRCNITRYCSKDCQINHWKSGHKKKCKKLKKTTSNIYTHIPQNKISKQRQSAISILKSNAFWKMFPYKYRQEGVCHSFHLQMDLSSFLLFEEHPLSQRYPKLFKKIEQTRKKIYSLNIQEIDELYGILKDVSLSEMKFWHKTYLSLLTPYDDEFQPFAEFIEFLDSAQFGDVIYLSNIPTSNGTYIFGFDDIDYSSLTKYFYANNSLNIDIDNYLKLKIIPNFFKKGQYEYNDEPFNCIPIEFCDAPIDYFANIPLNAYGNNEIRFIDPNRVHLNDYNQNIIFKNLNRKILDVLNGKTNTIEVAEYYGVILDDHYYKEKINIRNDVENNNFPKNYFVICDNLENANEFCWFKRQSPNTDIWDFDNLGIASWIKRYDDGSRAKQLFFIMQLESMCKYFGPRIIEIISCYLQ